MYDQNHYGILIRQYMYGHWWYQCNIFHKAAVKADLLKQKQKPNKAPNYHQKDKNTKWKALPTKQASLMAQV